LAVPISSPSNNIAVPAPGPREVRIRQAAAGVNYIDVYIGRGEYRMIERRRRLAWRRPAR